MRSWLQTLALPEGEQAELSAALRASSEFEVIDLLNKATVVTVAEVGGGVFSTLFSICSTFSILAGVLLIFLIFVMLAAERKSELGMARAVGLQRGHLIQMFVAEGLVYDLFAAALGLGLGLIISYAMIGYLSGLFRGIGQQFGSMAGVFRFYFHVTRPSLIIAYCLGVLLTFGVVVIASWRVSRLNIVAAIRDLGAETDTRGERPWLSAVGRLVRGPLLLVAGIVLMVTGGRQELTRLLIGATCALVGAAQVLDWALGRRTGMRPGARARLTYSLIGCGLLALWGLPWDRLLPAAPTSADAAAAAGRRRLDGALLYPERPPLDPGRHHARRLQCGLPGLGGQPCVGSAPAALAPVLRLAVAYPLSARFRTGMAMLLFAMVITTVVVMSIVIQATQTLVTPSAESTAGFDIVSQPTLLSLFNPMQDLSATLHAQTEVPLPDIVGWGAVSGEPVEARLAAAGKAADPPEAWRQVDLAGLDDGYLAQAGSIYTFDRRAEGYADDAAVWRALRERDDVAVLDRYLVAGGTADAGAPSLAPSAETDDGTLPRFRLQGLDLNSRAPLPQLELELRPRQNGAGGSRAGWGRRGRAAARAGDRRLPPGRHAGGERIASEHPGRAQGDGPGRAAQLLYQSQGRRGRETGCAGTGKGIGALRSQCDAAGRYVQPGPGSSARHSATGAGLHGARPVGGHGGPGSHQQPHGGRAAAADRHAACDRLPAGYGGLLIPARVQLHRPDRHLDRYAGGRADRPPDDRRLAVVRDPGPDGTGALGIDRRCPAAGLPVLAADHAAARAAGLPHLPG